MAGEPFPVSKHRRHPVLIYSFPKTVAGLSRFINRIKQGGNTHLLNPDTAKFEVFSRFQDDHYGPNADPLIIRQEEIGSAVEELEESNPGVVMDEKPRPSSLNDIISMRNSVAPEPVSNPEPVEEDEDTINEPSFGELSDMMDRHEDEETEVENDGEFLSEEEEAAVAHEAQAYAEHTAQDYVDDASLASLQEAARTISDAKKSRILTVIQDTLGTDLTDTSEILLMLAETAELKKSLSTILALLKIEVSMTVVSRDYKVQPKTLRFAADRTETLDNYRRGVAEMMTRIEEILASLDKANEYEATIKSLENMSEAAKRSHSVEIAKLNEDNAALRAKLAPQTLFDPKFILVWDDNGTHTYLTVEAGAKSATKEGPFEAATKRCGASFKQNEAFKFTSIESARNQVARLTQYAHNCAFFNGEKPTLMIARLGLDIVS